MRKLSLVIDRFDIILTEALTPFFSSQSHVLTSFFAPFFYRLEWESAILRGCCTFRRMEEDRLNQLRYLAEQYQQILDEHRPKLVSNAHRLDEPIRRIRVGRDMEVVRKKVIVLRLRHLLCTVHYQK